MSEGKRKSQGDDSGRRKKKYHSDGTPAWGKRRVEGPGVWVTCVKGKEKQAVGEIYELFESIASELWPKNSGKIDDLGDSDTEDTGMSLEDQVLKEISSMKRPRTEDPEQRFANCQTNTQCVIFISCKPPVDPVELVVQYIKSIEETGVTRTRYVHRLVPVSDTAVANIPEIESLCRKVFAAFFDQRHETKYTYKIELRARNHTTIPRQTIIQTVAQCVPEGHTVNLLEPQLFILVEVFKNVCGISLVEDYYRWHKFNVMEIANRYTGAAETGSRVVLKNKGSRDGTSVEHKDSSTD